MTADQPPSWEELCDAGRMIVDDLDAGKWELGDLALSLEKRYGHDQIGLFAIQIGKEKKSVQAYRQVAGFYKKSIRIDFLEPLANLRWSHCRLALRLKDIEEALVFLGTASDEGWTVEQARIELNRQLGKPERKERPLCMGEYIGFVRPYTTNGDYTFFFTSPEKFDADRRYRMVVYEYDEEEVSHVDNGSQPPAASALPASGAPAETR
jgi:hypothetical protein